MNTPAYPVKVKMASTSSDPLATPREIQMEGMTLLDYFAGQALPAIIEKGYSPAATAMKSYEIAEAMMIERQRHDH